MADPICRWRNSSVKQLIEFNSIFPLTPTEKSKARALVERNWQLFGGSNFFTTPYQLAAQMGIYYESDTMLYPRFNRLVDVNEACEYMQHWGRKYYAPNPYTKSILQEKSVIINNFLVNWAIDKGENALFSEALRVMFSAEIGNTDILINMINNFSEVQITDDIVVLKDSSTARYSEKDVWLDVNPNDKEMFFNLIGLSSYTQISPSLPPLDQPLQQIFYGAPGTGKSHTINRETKGRMTFRTTFHPDSDYSTFVGAYKPVMEEVETRVVPVVLNNGAVFDQNCGTLKEKKISYKFVKQAFMKAYIAAWRAFTINSNVTLTSQAPQSISLTYNNQTWILTEVDDDRVLYTKEEIISIEEYKKNVLTYWLTMPEPDEKTGKLKLGTFDHYQAAGCVWYKNKHGKDHSAEECWEAIKNVLEAGGTIEATPNSQTYSISLRDDVIVAVTRDNKATKKAVKGCFENAEADSSVQKRIAKELKEFNADDFDKAWEELKKVVNGVEVLESTNTIELSPVFLIIEEINRGNCAQIFGDLFQLLDRKEGFSQYPIHADEDVRKCLVSEHAEEDPSFGINGLELSEEQRSYINSVLDCEDDVAEKIAKGEVLMLPPNLYIWATMNTSDQSLFPIDSAFKRRWEWKYVKIKNHPEENYQIKLSDTDKRDWWEFVKQVNRIIASMTSSADKQLGYFFCKADGEGVISADKFVSKVLFYLWNDVFKDYGFEDASLFRYADATDPTKTHELTFPDFYDEEGEKVNIERVADFIGKVMAWDDNQKQA